MANTPDWMVLGAFRYAIGRRTYQVGVTVDWLIANLDSLSDGLLKTIGNEVDEGLKRDIKAREDGGKILPLGSDCDRADWLRLYAEIGNKWIKQRRTHESNETK